MSEAVEEWRRDRAGQGLFDGEFGPVPTWWNLPDLITEWELANPELAVARKVEAERLAAKQAEEEAAEQEKEAAAAFKDVRLNRVSRPRRR
jgi:hypothetical protein